MLTAEALIANIVTTIVGKAASALGKLSFDKRRKACRALLKLYYAIQSLDEVTERLLLDASTINPRGTAHSLIVGLVGEQDSIEIATNAFIDLSNELQRGLAIVDPALGDLCVVIYRGKGDFLDFMSHAIDLNLRSTEAVVTILRPNARILATNFDDAYKQSQRAVSRGETYYWPSRSFDYFNDFEAVVIRLGDNTAATDLLEMIKSHHALLREAKNKLRELLKSSFSVEEILFHENLTPR